MERLCAGRRDRHPERCKRLILLSAGLPAPRAARRGMGLPVRLLLLLARYAPGVMGRLLGGGRALRSRRLPVPDGVGQVGDTLRRLRADLLQGHAGRVHALDARLATTAVSSVGSTGLATWVW